MRHKKVKRCKDCDKETSELSQRGICFKCSMKRSVNAHQQFVNRSGPIYEKWKHNLSRSLERREEKKRG